MERKSGRIKRDRKRRNRGMSGSRHPSQTEGARDHEGKRKIKNRKKESKKEKRLLRYKRLF